MYVVVAYVGLIYVYHMNMAAIEQSSWLLINETHF